MGGLVVLLLEHHGLLGSVGVRIAMSGASGLIGRALAEALRERGDELTPISRRAHGDTIAWEPRVGMEPRDALSGFDVLIHLAGESVAGRWTAPKKARIRDSRVLGTRTMVAALREANPRPPLFLCASALGIYGERGELLVTESSPAGEGFLAEVCVEWEREAMVAQELEGTRVCLARFGMVLSAEGGALAKMLPLYRRGLGGPVGSGAQWMAWIHVRDAVEALLSMIDDERSEGAYNLVAPQPVRNAEFSGALAQVLGRRARLRIPAFAIRVGLGEMGAALLLGSQRAAPARLLEAGFEFGFADLKAALEELV